MDHGTYENVSAHGANDKYQLTLQNSINSAGFFCLLGYLSQFKSLPVL